MSEHFPVPDPPRTGLPTLASAPRVKDPVCGMMVDPQKPAAKFVRGDKTYYFCSKGCAQKFENNPQKFLAAPGTAGLGASPHAGHDQHAAQASQVPSSP